jgi:hypothetical protein
MNPQREWFCEYVKYNGCGILFRYDFTTIIIGHGRVKLLRTYRNIRTLPGVLHIPKLARNFISVSKMGDTVVQIVFEKEMCEMV